MKKASAAFVVVLLFALGSWIFLSRDAAPPTEPRTWADGGSAPRRDSGRRASAPDDGAVGENGKPESAAAEAAAPPNESGPARIAGRVTDERTGAGVAEAEVFALRGDASKEQFDVAKARTRTDADGRFKIENLAVGPHHVAARAPGRVDAHAHGVEAVEGGGRELELVLLAPRSIAGRVVAPPGVPPEGALAQAMIPNDRTAKWDWWTNVGAATTVGADGSFVLVGLTPREFDVGAELKVGDRRWSAGVRAVETDGPPVTLTLEESVTPMHRLRLRVLDPAGRPVASGKARKFILQWSGTTQWGTDSIKDGILEQKLPEFVRCLWWEPFRYCNAAGDDVAAAPVLVRLSIPDDLEKTIRLEPPVSLAGRVRDASGEGVPGARVIARPASSPLDAGLNPQPHGDATTGDDGGFRIDGLASIDYSLDVEVPPDFLPELGAAARPGVPAEIVLRAALRPVVTVLDADGRTVAGAEVRLLEKEDDVAITARTGVDGKAHLDRVEPGRRFRLVAEMNDDRFSEAVVPEWTPADAEVRLPPGLVVRGTVVGRDGAPVPGATVVLRGRNGERDDSDDTNDRGVFLFERVAPGDVLLAVSPTRDDTASDAPTFPAKAGDRAVLLVVDPGLVLRAKIENWGDRDNSLICNAPHFVEDGAVPSVRHQGTHRGDRLSFTGLPPGRTGTIVFGPLEGGFTAFRPGVRTDAGEATVTLDRGPTLEGRIVFPSGISPHVGEPDVWADVLGLSFRGQAYRSGRWSIPGVPEGTWTVHARLRLAGKTYEASAQASPGVAADLELR